MYGITGHGQLENELILIDPETGVGTLIGGMNRNDVSALAARIDSFTTSVGQPSADGIPGSFSLDQNFPNPFNPTTEIRFGLPTASNVTLTVYNMLGQEVVKLVNGNLPAGYRSVTWDGVSASGSSVASGLYFYKLEASGVDGRSFATTRKMLLLK
jgi:hypothetical protein